MSQTAILNGTDAERFINHALRASGTDVQVVASVSGDVLTLRADQHNEIEPLAIPRTPFGCWFAESLVPIAVKRFGPNEPSG